MLAAFGDDGLSLWRPQTGKMLKSWTELKGLSTVSPITLHGGETLLLCKYSNSSISNIFVSPVSGQVLEHLRIGAGLSAHCVIVDQGRTLIAWSDIGDIHVTDISSGEVDVLVHPDRIVDLCSIADIGRAGLIFGASDRSVRLWDRTTHACLHTIDVHHSVRQCLYSAGQLVVGLDAGLVVIDVERLISAFV